ncbi:MAG: hypothetical protein ACLP53_33465 [Isosphaeraceae bacterium]
MNAGRAAVDIAAEIGDRPNADAGTRPVRDTRPIVGREVSVEHRPFRADSEDGVTRAVLVPGAKDAFHNDVAKAGATGDQVLNPDGEGVRFVVALQVVGLAGDNRGRGTSLAHLAEDLHQLARPEGDVEEWKRHPGRAGPIFQEH